MSSPYSGANTFVDPIMIPSDGDPPNFATINTAFQAIIDRTAWLHTNTPNFVTGGTYTPTALTINSPGIVSLNSGTSKGYLSLTGTEAVLGYAGNSVTVYSGGTSISGPFSTSGNVSLTGGSGAAFNASYTGTSGSLVFDNTGNFLVSGPAAATGQYSPYMQVSSTQASLMMVDSLGATAAGLQITGGTTLSLSGSNIKCDVPPKTRSSFIWNKSLFTTGAHMFGWALAVNPVISTGDILYYYQTDLYNNVLIVPIELPIEYCAINAFGATLMAVGGHTALPITMPQVKLVQIENYWGTSSPNGNGTVVASATDASTSTGLYQYAHQIVGFPSSPWAPGSSQKAFIMVTGEGGVGAISGLIVYDIWIQLESWNVGR